MLGQALQQPDELALLGFVEPGQEFGIVLVGGGLGLGKQVAGRGREVHGVSTPIAGVAAVCDESAFLQVVDQPDHGVAVDGHGIGERLLGLPIDRGQVAEQPEVTGVQPKRP